MYVCMYDANVNVADEDYRLVLVSLMLEMNERHDTDSLLISLLLF
jgi:hypothetical protein